MLEPRTKHTPAQIPAFAALLLVMLLAWALSGCKPIVGEPTAGLGVYKFAATPEGCTVEANTIKGGPDAECVIDDRGTRMSVSPSRAMVIDALTDFLAP